MIKTRSPCRHIPKLFFCISMRATAIHLRAKIIVWKKNPWTKPQGLFFHSNHIYVHNSNIVWCTMWDIIMLHRHRHTKMYFEPLSSRQPDLTVHRNINSLYTVIHLHVCKRCLMVSDTATWIEEDGREWPCSLIVWQIGLQLQDRWFNSRVRALLFYLSAVFLHFSRLFSQYPSVQMDCMQHKCHLGWDKCLKIKKGWPGSQRGRLLNQRDSMLPSC